MYITDKGEKMLENGKIIRDIDNHDYSAEKELEDYFNIKEE